jgi:hypothetical protein
LKSDRNGYRQARCFAVQGRRGKLPLFHRSIAALSSISTDRCTSARMTRPFSSIVAAMITVPVMCRARAAYGYTGFTSTILRGGRPGNPTGA